MMHLGKDADNIEILLDNEGKTIKLIDLLQNIQDINSFN